MQLLGSRGLRDPGPEVQRASTIPGSARPGSAAGSKEGGGQRVQGQARVEFFSQVLQTGVPHFLIQSDGHFSGEGAEPPNFLQEHSPSNGRGGGEAKCWGGRLIVAQREGEGPGASLQRLTALTGPH